MEHLYLDHDGWNLVFYTGKEPLNPVLREIHTNVRVIQGRPNLHMVIPNIIYGMESGKGRPENCTPSHLSLLKEELLAPIMNNDNDNNNDNNDNNNTNSTKSDDEKLKEIMSYVHGKGFLLTELFHNLEDEIHRGSVQTTDPATSSPATSSLNDFEDSFLTSIVATETADGGESREIVLSPTNSRNSSSEEGFRFPPSPPSVTSTASTTASHTSRNQLEKLRYLLECQEHPSCGRHQRCNFRRVGRRKSNLRGSSNSSSTSFPHKQQPMSTTLPQRNGLTGELHRSTVIRRPSANQRIRNSFGTLMERGKTISTKLQHPMEGIIISNNNNNNNNNNTKDHRRHQPDETESVAMKYVKSLEKKLVLDSWGILYCGGSKPVEDTLNDISKEFSVKLNVETFAW